MYAVHQLDIRAAMQRVPAVKDLPAIVSAMLVKPIPPALDASGEGLFTTVIPDNRCHMLAANTNQCLILVQGAALKRSIETLDTATHWAQPHICNVGARSVVGQPTCMSLMLRTPSM